MNFELPKLPFEPTALEPWISEETLEFHYGHHHRAYVDKVNTLKDGTRFSGATLEQIIQGTEGALFDNAAQAWNHTFYWNCLGAELKDERLRLPIQQAVKRDFGSMDALRAGFFEMAMDTFGSGWTWLVKDKFGLLSVVATHNADNPMCHGFIPVLACDVWEHAYYIDYRNARAKYLTAFWKLVNWHYVNQCFLDSNVAALSAQMSAHGIKATKENLISSA